MLNLAPDWSFFTDNWSFGNAISTRRKFESIEPLSPTHCASSSEPIEPEPKSFRSTSSTQTTTISLANPTSTMDQYPQSPSKSTPESMTPNSETTSSILSTHDDSISSASSSATPTTTTMDQISMPSSSYPSSASSATLSRVDDNDKSNNGGKRKRDDELCHDSPSAKKRNTAKHRDLINSDISEEHMIGAVGDKVKTRSMRERGLEGAAEQSPADKKNTRLNSCSSKKKLGQVGTSPPVKTRKLNNSKSVLGKKRQRKDATVTSDKIFKEQARPGSSKQAHTLSAAKTHYPVLRRTPSDPSRSGIIVQLQFSQEWMDAHRKQVRKKKRVPCQAAQKIWESLQSSDFWS